MGRGDKKTKKGKIFKGSFGKTRPATEKRQPAMLRVQLPRRSRNKDVAMTA